MTHSPAGGVAPFNDFSQEPDPLNEFQRIRQHCIRLAGLFGARDAMFEEIRQQFHMEWQEMPSGEWIKPTMSPSSYNAVIGAVRLMTSTDPQLSAGFGPAKDKLERAARAMWNSSSRVSLRPAHYDLILSGLLFGEVVASVDRTSDLLEFAKKSGRAEQIARAEYIAAETPYLITTYNPATCYPDRDHLGLRGLLRKTKQTWGEVVDTWGDAALLLAPTRRRLDEVDVWDWYDWRQRVVWADQYSEPIYMEDHGLPFMPVVHALIEGTGLFVQPEHQRFPMLYSVWKSGMWKRENLSLTTLFTLIFNLASNPLLVHETNDEDPLVIDRTVPGGVTKIKPGEKLAPLVEKVIDASQEFGLTLAKEYNEKSTINQIALSGQLAAGGHLSYSAISLMMQSARLPLTGIKQVGGWVIAALLNISMRWYKADSKGIKFYHMQDGQEIDIQPSDIPERVAFSCALEPDIPSDKMNLTNIADLLVRSGLASKRWARENILSIGQSDDMDKEIWGDQRLTTELQNKLQELTALKQAEVQQRIQQAQMAMQQQMAAQQMPPPGAGPQGPNPQPALASAPGAPQPPLNNLPPGGQVGPGGPMTAPMPTGPQPGTSGGGPTPRR